MQDPEGSNSQIRKCYIASRVFCPMSTIERDSNHCLRCAHFAGVNTDDGHLAMICTFEPKDRDSIPVFEIVPRAA